MKQDHTKGVVVFYREKGEILFLLVQGYGNFWGFPKGHTEPGETAIQTALRELEEETNVKEITIVPDLTFHEEYTIMKKKGGAKHKKVSYFVGEVFSKNAQRQRSEIKKLGWFTKEEAYQRLVEAKRDIIDEVYQYILQ